MRTAALVEGGASRLSDDLRRLRDSLRPASVLSTPSRIPFDNVWSLDDRLLHLSRNVEEHIGWSWDYLIRSQPGLTLFRPGDAGRLYPHFFRCLMGYPARGVEYCMRHSDGRGYVWLTDDMAPGRRGADGRVLEVAIRSYNVTAIRACEIDFLIECLERFNPRRDAPVLEELGVPALLESVLPHTTARSAGRIVPFPAPPIAPASPPGMEAALSGNMNDSRWPPRPSQPMKPDR